MYKKFLYLILFISLFIFPLNGCRKKSLHQAVLNDSIKDIERLILKGNNVNSKDERGWTPLQEAAGIGRLDAAILLVKHGADIEARNNSGQTPLHTACANSRISSNVVQLLVSKGADVNAKAKQGETPLHMSMYGGNPDVVQFLLDNGADVNSTDISGGTPLLWIAEAEEPLVSDTDKEKIVKILLKAGADPMRRNGISTPMGEALLSENENLARIMADSIDLNKKSSNGSIPIHFAIRTHNTRMVKFLLNYGCDFNIRDEDGYTPLYVARLVKDKEIIKLLEAKGAIEKGPKKETIEFKGPSEEETLKRIEKLLASGTDINLKGIQGMTELHQAVLNNQPKVVEFLVTNKADLNVYDDNGRTPLHYAFITGQFDIAKLLIEKKADVNLKEKNNGTTPLHFAIGSSKGPDLNVIKLLINSGADINSQNKYGVTPLNLSVMRGDIDLTKFLIKEGANVNLSDQWGKSPLHSACDIESKELVEILVENGAEINAQDNKGIPPLACIFPPKNSEPNEIAIVEFLEKHGGKTLGFNRIIE